MRITENEIKEKIISNARNNKKTIEGIYYYDISSGSFEYMCDVFSLAHALKMARNNEIKNVRYYKCTKSGKLEVSEIY